MWQLIELSMPAIRKHLQTCPLLKLCLSRETNCRAAAAMHHHRRQASRNAARVNYQPEDRFMTCNDHLVCSIAAASLFRSRFPGFSSFSSSLANLERGFDFLASIGCCNFFYLFYRYSVLFALLSRFLYRYSLRQFRGFRELFLTNNFRLLQVSIREETVSLQRFS